MKQFHYANLGRRFVALFIDFVILSAVFFPVTRIVKGTWVMSSQNHIWNYGMFVTDPLCLIFLVVIVLYFILLEGVFGATIGKKILGLSIVQVDGQNAGMKRSIIRNLLRVVDALPAFNILGIVLIVSSSERTRFGDRVAGTRVIIRQ